MGVLYYFATQKNNDVRSYLIVCFDIRSEEFKFIYIDFIRGQDRMINYKGKLGIITLEYDYNPWVGILITPTVESVPLSCVCQF